MLLHDYLEYFARETPDQHFAEMDGEVLTYAEADVRANRFANSLIAAGLAKGDRFSYISKNSIDFCLMYYAGSKAGVVPVPLNYRLAPREWQYIITDSGSRLVFCEAEFAAGLDQVKVELPEVTLFIQLSGEQRPGWIGFESWLQQDCSRPQVKVTGQDQVYQMYTSGTTGRPKGAMLSQDAVCNNITMGWVYTASRLGKERNLIQAPVYHAAASLTTMSVISGGNTLVIMREFDPTVTVERLEHEGITMTTMVPAMIQSCLVNVDDIATRDFSNLRLVSYGASPIALETLQQAIAVFGCDFAQGFGMTELTCVATFMSPAVHRRAVNGEPGLLRSAGRAILGTAVKIVDEQDNEVPRGTVGEILVKGPQVMMGYWNMPEASEKALAGGWMHTGDAAYMDDEGFIYIQDRIKDMIVSGGENIYPAEIESVLFEHGAVADAAVIGIPDEQWGETVMAFVVLRQGSNLQLGELQEFCRASLAGFKIPRRLEILQEIPRNASGKVLKASLREPYWQGHERRVS